jgi:hypothetical protein
VNCEVHDADALAVDGHPPDCGSGLGSNIRTFGKLPANVDRRRRDRCLPSRPETVCGEEPFEAGRLSQCIERNKDKVSPACQAVWPSAAAPQQARPTDLRSAQREARQACAADLRSFCDGKRGRERGDCLRDNREKFSSTCLDAMRNVRSARQAQRRGSNQQDEDDQF